MRDGEKIQFYLLRQLRLSATSSEVPVEGEVVLEVQLVELILGGALQELVERVEVVLARLRKVKGYMWIFLKN